MKINHSSNNHLLSRELSWLQFNSRVLQEAKDENNPLLERLKFIAIFSSNLDEFFMVRVAGLRQLEAMGKSGNDPSGYPPSVHLEKIHELVMILVKQQYNCYGKIIRPALKTNGIDILSYNKLNDKQRRVADAIFKSKIMPVLTPLAIDPSHPFPLLRNGVLQIAVQLKSYQSHNDVHSFVEVPECLPRFIRLSDTEHQNYILIEELIMGNLEYLYQGGKIIDKLPFRITRDMDFTINEEGVEDLLQYLEKELISRRSRNPIRLELPKGKKSDLRNWLLEQFELNDKFIYQLSGPLHLAGFMELVFAAQRPDLLEVPWKPLPMPEFNNAQSILDVMDQQSDILCCVPFQDFEPVVRMIKEAAEATDVLAIKQTLYRVSGNSPIIHALQRAAENGKQVTVIVELKARFDEGNNIQWARKLEESGAHVIYGIPGLKVHCKSLLIIRNHDGLIKRYCHLGTGNYNDKTAKLYTDMGLFTTDKALCSDIAALFNVMTGYSSPKRQWNKISISPFDLRERVISLIDNEAKLSSKRNPGHIIAKLNSLSDPEIIKHLYQAAEAGVKIDLIVRGICCLKIDQAQKNIKVISIVDRFLEHSRIYYFHNGGDSQYFLASADWMPRNLDRRIELLFPVEDKRCRKTIAALLQFQLNDQCKARQMKPDSNYKHSRTSNYTTRSQAITYQYFKSIAEQIPGIADAQILMPLTAPENHSEQ